jgi:hypothetical protein
MSASESFEDLWTEWQELRDELSTWHFYVGPIGISARFNSMRFTRYFVGLHLLVALCGTDLIFVSDGVPRDLGLALVVGALFGFGAFIAQVWRPRLTAQHGYARTRCGGESKRSTLESSVPSSTPSELCRQAQTMAAPAAEHVIQTRQGGWRP